MDCSWLLSMLCCFLARCCQWTDHAYIGAFNFLFIQHDVRINSHPSPTQAMESHMPESHEKNEREKKN
jgi:hypothetical protein